MYILYICTCNEYVRKYIHTHTYTQEKNLKHEFLVKLYY